VPGDSDQLGPVNNVTYLRWVQDIAVAQWKSTALREDQERLLRVVLRHEIDYKRPAFLGEAIIARTWVGHARGLRFERHSEFFRASDGRSVVKARTVWCPLDASTAKPVEVSPDVRAGFSSS
jgi:acyl-CoA thioester hydrolase